MNTLHVGISYRPLRIAWAVMHGDFDGLRRAMRASFALWGGRFNPIIVADRPDEADALVSLFRADFVVGAGASDEVDKFGERYPHLLQPYFSKSVFEKPEGGYRPYANVLDVQNALVALRGRSEWKAVLDEGFCVYDWKLTDPLADVLLAQLGAYPDPSDVGTDYRRAVLEMTGGHAYGVGELLGEDLLAYAGPSFLSRIMLEPDFDVPSNTWDQPGFFVGSATDFDDLVTFWNLRASDVTLWFVDPDHIARFGIIKPWETRTRDRLAGRPHEWGRSLGIWSNREKVEPATLGLQNDSQISHFRVSSATWNRLNLIPPRMSFRSVASLGVVGTEKSPPQVSFSYVDKPFSADSRFHSQHLVASLSFIGSVDERHTLRPPYVPELNEFYAREMVFDYSGLRSEPSGVGRVIHVTDASGILRALPTPLLYERLFGLAGFAAEPSEAGLIARQLIARLGGLQGARVLKIPGARRLFRAHGLNSSFERSEALRLIGSTDPDRPSAKFSDHADLYVEARRSGEKLTPQSVFEYLADKGLVRSGIDLRCPNCRLASWYSLDELGENVSCSLCGDQFGTGRILASRGALKFRRSGVLGLEKNSLGAIPVALTLQQLDTSLDRTFEPGLYSESLLLRSSPSANPIEVDLAWTVVRAYPRRTALVLGECKDGRAIQPAEVEKLVKIAVALPRHRFKPFILLAQLSPFEGSLVEAAKKANAAVSYQRVIMLGADELEPYHVYDRADQETLGHGKYASSPEDLARATAVLYSI